uniref:SFRICE_028327 n=1 Tax=Spodoptera frugiperda TaxID=7108 RepID=A0A2H1WB28_SPOFR
MIMSPDFRKKFRWLSIRLHRNICILCFFYCILFNPNYPFSRSSQIQTIALVAAIVQTRRFRCLPCRRLMRWTKEFRLQFRFRVVCLAEGLQSYETDSRPKGLALNERKYHNMIYQVKVVVFKMNTGIKQNYCI